MKASQVTNSDKFILNITLETLVFQKLFQGTNKEFTSRPLFSLQVSIVVKGERVNALTDMNAREPVISTRVTNI